MENVPSKTCPLCGKPNDCGIATDSAACWCTNVTIPAAILEAIPLEARNLVCICKACATKGP